MMYGKFNCYSSLSLFYLFNLFLITLLFSLLQILSIREGLASVIPESALNLLTWRELERAVCGDPDISVSVLKSACKLS